MGAELKEKVLELVRLKGPVTPTIITQEIGMSTYISSALLAELAGSNQIRISNVKMGSTPLYYAPGQEEKLQEYVTYLHEKEKQAYEQLKKELVMQDSSQDPVVRVALRTLKDFAKPLTVQADGKEELFWKWYLLSNEEAEPHIKKILGIKEEKPVKTEKAETKEKQQRLAEKEEKPGERTKEEPTGEMGKRLNEYFKKNKVEIVREIEVKKTEASYIISVPSSVGSVRYYCKVKDKKTCNEGDLSTAYVIGENKKLPVLFLTTGSLSKRAQEMLEEEFSSLNVKQI